MDSTTSEPKPLPKPAKGNIAHLLAFGMGAGCSPKAPGTMGTLLAVAVYLPLSRDHDTPAVDRQTVSHRGCDAERFVQDRAEAAHLISVEHVSRQALLE